MSGGPVPDINQIVGGGKGQRDAVLPWTGDPVVWAAASGALRCRLRGIWRG